MDIITLNTPVKEETDVVTSEKTIPLYIYAAVISSVSIIVGLIWDISWHTSIGRDGLLSPPHLAIYFGGIVAGLFSGYEVLRITFTGSPEEKKNSLKFWGIFYGSLGPLFCIWGAFAMLTSAPFDDWWHNTYGLDVTILSPPHTVLALGMIFIQFGAMSSVMTLQNRVRISNEKIAYNRNRLIILYGMAAGFLLAMVFSIASQYLGKHRMHGALFYQVASLLFPMLLVAVSRASLGKWGATLAASVYTAILMVMVWVLQLFPAEPLLGPVVNPITNFQAFEFPLLLIVPAVVIDLVTQKKGHLNSWVLSVIYAAAFLIPFIIVQWPFAEFLQTEYARNIIFGQESWYFGSDPDYEYRYAFPPWLVNTGLDLIKGLAIALVVGFLSSRIGISWGKWMKNIYR